MTVGMEPRQPEDGAWGRRARFSSHAPSVVAVVQRPEGIEDVVDHPNGARTGDLPPSRSALDRTGVRRPFGKQGPLLASRQEGMPEHLVRMREGVTGSVSRKRKLARDVV